MEIFYNKSVKMQNIPNFVLKIDMGFALCHNYKQQPHGASLVGILDNG
jgi:hypothetical protein